MATGDRDDLIRLFDAACARLDAGRLAAAAVARVPPGSRVLALGKVAHRQMRAALAERPDLQPLLSISTDEGPEPWAIAGEHPIPDIGSLSSG